ncbi:MAG TPA: 4-hydroxy-tetrahydrodipicolinate synthase [Chitinophagaceae bacterium]|nr:4-hydroxy-tetrahydrodipicolinate synthase [Chitinophagaceae bacterium]
MSLRDQLKGTGVALVTPFKENGAIDFEALQNLIKTVLEGGVQYLVTLGTTGEPPVLTEEEKREVLQCTYEAAGNKVPVVVGVGGNDTASVIEEMKSLPLEKSIAVLSASPYYNKPSQEGIYQHYKALAAASPRPLIIYNVPGRTGSNISAATTIRLALEVENIKGVKEASGNMIQCMHILRQRPDDFLVTSGDDHVTLPLIACGMDGVISVAANCFAKDFSSMVDAALNNNYELARTIQHKLLEGYDLLFAENNPAGVKAFLSEMGLIKNYLRLPLVPLSEPLLQKVRKYQQDLSANA